MEVLELGACKGW